MWIRPATQLFPIKYDIGIWFEEGLARVAIRKDGLWYFGFIDKEGNEVIPLIYADARDFSNGRAMVKVYADDKDAATADGSRKEATNGGWITIDTRGNRIAD